MRSWFVPSRCALCALMILSLSCAKAKPPQAAPPAPSITLEGEVKLVGGPPAEGTLTLADAGGNICVLTSPRLEYELRSLDGQTVRVTGKLLGKTPEGPEFSVESYELAPVGGMVPVVGALEERDGALALTDAKTGSVYRLRGALAAALKDYAGYRVWVSGPKMSVDGVSGGGMAIDVQSYGILGPPARSTPAP